MHIAQCPSFFNLFHCALCQLCCVTKLFQSQESPAFPLQLVSPEAQPAPGHRRVVVADDPALPADLVPEEEEEEEEEVRRRR